MDTALLTKLQVSRLGKESRRLVVVAAYEDLATESRVNEFCERLNRQLGEGCELVKQMWLLVELRAAQLRTIAAQEAATADVIMVSVHHAESLPAEVREWIDLWLPGRSRQPAILLALFDPPYCGISTSMQVYLQEVAARAKMEFVVQTEESPTDWA